MTDYTKSWDALPQSVRDKLGTDMPFTSTELSALVGAETVVHVQWDNQPPGMWDLRNTFALFAAERLEAEAEEIDSLEERVRVAKVPLDDPSRELDPAPLTESETHQSVQLRSRARRLRDGEPHQFPTT